MTTESSAQHPSSNAYAAAGVNYDLIDRSKRLALELARLTHDNMQQHLGAKVVRESLGESAFVWEEPDAFRTLVLECLGTKSLVADAWYKITGQSHDDKLAQDTVAMIVNDLATVGASPMVINAYFAAGSSARFAQYDRMEKLIRGWATACNQVGAVWGGGESPALSGIILDEAMDLAGASVGIVKPKSNLTLGNLLNEGDSIFVVGSNGIHANGLSLARRVARGLPQGYETRLPDGTFYGEALLSPTHLYPKFISDLFKEEIIPHYMANITGHGWRKFMRARQKFSYIIDRVPNPQTIFTFLQEQEGFSDEEAYATFNMNAGLAVMLSKDHISLAHDIAQRHGFSSLEVGYLEKGPKRVVIRPKGITFTEESLQVR